MRPLVFALAILLPANSAAQGPSAPWRTIETASFRVHYPAPFETWTLRVAARLESIREQVAREVGYAPPARVDVVVMDPVSSPNGFALPFLGSPRMVLWTTPPSADAVIGQYADWGELLVVHEDAHLVHLLRPSRNPVVGFLERTLLPVGPITRRAPRWVIEGYATVLEGRLTGLGRPYSDMRAAILRRWAQEGRLPSYGRLSADRDRWQGMSMAYLAGSAYLEWLLERGGPDSLRHLWARLTARTVRSFDGAFRGVFGDTPEALYGRFTAELTRQSLQAEQIIEPVRRDGILWQRLEWSTGEPAVSPDGTRLAIVLHDRDRPARLAVFDTGPDEEAEREWRDQIERRLARDPEDVPPVRVDPLPRRPVHQLPAIHGAEPRWPRWMPDGESILFVRFEPDGEGLLHPDLFRWRLEDGRVERLTRLADLHRPDPAPDGTWAVAVRHRHGYSQLVRVDLETASIEAITPPSVETGYDRPRLSPDGSRLAYLRNDEESWRAVVRNLSDGTEGVLPAPPQASLAHPAWSRDGRTLYLSIGQHGFIDIHALPIPDSAAGEAAEPARAITRTHGAALAAAPAPEGHGLYFLSLEPHGLDLRFLESEAAAERLPDLPDHLVPAVPPAAPERPERRIETVEPGRAFGFGRQEFFPLFGGASAPSSRALEIGVRGGDLLGRLNYLAIGSVASQRRGPVGAVFAAAWRGWPVALTTHLFTVEEMPSQQPDPVAEIGRALDVNRRGIEIGINWRRRGRPANVHAAGGALFGQVEPAEGDWLGQRIAFGRAGYAARPSRDQWHARHGGDLRVDAGRTGAASWQRVTIALEAGAGYGGGGIAARLERRSVHGPAAPFDRVLVGGMPSSVLPPAVLAGRRLAPPVPLGTRIGDEHQAFRIELRGAGGPVLFYERHRARDRGAPWGNDLEWIGAEIHVSGGPLPLLFLPAAEATVGVARLLDSPSGRRTRWWAGLRWAP